jgi:hypothetical protein
LFQLRGNNGEEPPTLYLHGEGDGLSTPEICSSIASFSTGVILGSAGEAHCENHQSFEADCDQCIALKEVVVKFQSHRHTFTCHKKKRRILIGDEEGHGRMDGKKKTVPLDLRSCRFKFPKNPIDKTEFILGFREDTDTDKAIVKKAKIDYDKIRKFLLRLTSAPNYENTEEWKNFIKFSFFQFLYEVGMFDTDDWSDVEAQKRARARYLTALR